MHTFVTILLGVALLTTLGVLVCVWRARGEMVSAQAVRDVLNGVDEPDYGPDCRHPGCMWKRMTLADLLDRAR